MKNSLLLLAVWLGLTVPLGAVTLDIGKLSIVDSGPGVYVVLVENFTGDPLGGGTALPPDFPVYTPLTLQSPVLSVVRNMVTELYGLPDIAPGSVDSLAAFLPGDPGTLTPFAFVDFPIDEVTSVTLSFTVNPLAISDYLGVQYLVDGPLFSFTLSPAPGGSGYLVFGDMTTLQITATAEVPEPSTAWLAALSLIALSGRRACAKAGIRLHLRGRLR